VRAPGLPSCVRASLPVPTSRTPSHPGAFASRGVPAAGGAGRSPGCLAAAGPRRPCGRCGAGGGVAHVGDDRVTGSASPAGRGPAMRFAEFGSHSAEQRQGTQRWVVERVRPSVLVPPPTDPLRHPPSLPHPRLRTHPPASAGGRPAPPRPPAARSPDTPQPFVALIGPSVGQRHRNAHRCPRSDHARRHNHGDPVLTGGSESELGVAPLVRPDDATPGSGRAWVCGQMSKSSKAGHPARRPWADPLVTTISASIAVMMHVHQYSVHMGHCVRNPNTLAGILHFPCSTAWRWGVRRGVACPGRA
jgi:hypothetical protein